MTPREIANRVYEVAREENTRGILVTTDGETVTVRPDRAIDYPGVVVVAS